MIGLLHDIVLDTHALVYSTSGRFLEYDLLTNYVGNRNSKYVVNDNVFSIFNILYVKIYILTNDKVLGT